MPPRWLIWPVVLLLAFSALGASEEGCGDTGGGNESGESQDSSDKGKGDKEKPCGSKATDDCTPRVGSDEAIEVDALKWQIVSAETTPTLGDQEFGLGEKANGVFLVVKLKVTSKKDESATLSDDTIKLDAGGTTYSPDNKGTVAAVGAGEDPLFFEDIGPDSTLESLVVYDVPEKVLGKKLYLRFNELGLGSTHGFIRLPEPTPRD